MRDQRDRGGQALLDAYASMAWNGLAGPSHSHLTAEPARHRFGDGVEESRARSQALSGPGVDSMLASQARASDCTPGCFG